MSMMEENRTDTQTDCTDQTASADQADSAGNAVSCVCSEGEPAGESAVCSCRTKHRGSEEFTLLINRLSRIEGQIRGVKKMVESDAYCPDILIQTAAVQAALKSFSRELLSNHIQTCVADGIRSGDNDIIEELMSLLKKMM